MAGPKAALLVALLAQVALSYLAMSGNNLDSGTQFTAVMQGVNYAEMPYGLADIAVYGRQGEPINFSVYGERLYFSGGYARIEGEYPAYVCDYSYLPKHIKGAEKDAFIVDICSSGRPVFADEFKFTDLPADRKVFGIVYYPYYPYSEENITRLASADEPLYFDVTDYAYSNGVLNIKQRLLVNPSNWSNIFLVIFEDPDTSFAPQMEPKNPMGDSTVPSNSTNDFLVPIAAAVAMMAIAALAWYKHVRK